MKHDSRPFELLTLECSYETKMLAGNLPFYGHVSLEVTTLRTPWLEVEVHDLQWRATIEFACQYFLQKFYKNRGSLKVIAKLVNGHSPDTSELVIFYTTVQALCRGFQIDCTLKIDEQGNVVVPK
ncbi:hypothetical protein [Pseudochryseolinea flava]|nr:hypothetical protein [Pseudochryseolinea flava]